jgi:hypothetical protein
MTAGAGVQIIDLSPTEGERHVEPATRELFGRRAALGSKLDSSAIAVAAENGIVTLRGTTSSRCG